MNDEDQATKLEFTPFGNRRWLTMADFKEGDRIILINRSLRGQERLASVVTYVNFNGLGGITFVPDWDAGDEGRSGSGWFDPATVGSKPYGIIGVEHRNK